MFDFFPQIRLQNSWQVILNPPQINLNSIFAFYMKVQEEIKKRRTFGIISHPDAGKTTLTEKLLLFGGAIQTAGAVKNNKIKKSATSDFMEIEKQRGISVATSVMAFNYRDKQINILDTPGHKDFAEDTYRTLTAVDSVIMVIDCANGVEKNLWKFAECETPQLLFLSIKWIERVRMHLTCWMK